MNDSIKALIAQAFDNQNVLNSRLNPEWRRQGWNYYRAIWTEMAEATGHTNWYWWKTGEYNQAMSDAQLAELHIELCDVLHFGLSLDMVNAEYGGRSTENRIVDYVQAFDEAVGTSIDLVDSLEAVVVDAILLRDFNVKKFARACAAANLSLSGLMAYYFAKSALNRFRWNNGYNEKTYVKMWRLPGTPKAVEDNTFLAGLVGKLISANSESDVIHGLASKEFTDLLYSRLDAAYKLIEK